MTVVQAAIEVLKKHPEGLPIEEIYDEICKRNLYVFKAKTPMHVLLGLIRRQCYGIDFPSAYPVKYFSCSFIDGNTYYSLPKSSKSAANSNVNDNNDSNEDQLPEELVIKSYRKHIADIKKQLLDAILDEDKPKNERATFFEKLVVDLIISLGYGRDNDSGEVRGGSHDGGIDGIIYEDRLGLDRIYIQAKCYARGRAVSSAEVQSFVGAMLNVQKGVFVTTSHFSKEAKEYIIRQQTKSIKLINGDDLTELMVNCSVGLKTVDRLSIYELDKNYFMP